MLFIQTFQGAAVSLFALHHLPLSSWNLYTMCIGAISSVDGWDVITLPDEKFKRYLLSSRITHKFQEPNNYNSQPRQAAFLSASSLTLPRLHQLP